MTQVRAEILVNGTWLPVYSIHSAPHLEHEPTVLEPVSADETMVDLVLRPRLEKCLQWQRPVWVTCTDGTTVFYAAGAAGPFRIAPVRPGPATGWR
ncbi:MULTISPECIES: hypothetical protein [Streptomyces]|uniref:Uncharacterized protein n=2 Tax=Streptomyces TaxID=1883 RepID=A0A420V0G1_9ACTN|nr:MULTISPECIES: hypothetical protein [Streptomyces]KNE83719.1 hypothetical protein ADZ36_03625 [Streptomyces fradiae]MBQ0987313.1 hypothetical protein [Streptomyces sp. F63]MCC3652042.1 hypothetical protein [Streptomyces sp. S07_1.15]MCC9739733.1 hypothetical protein [Streptomyces sp. MNU89]OFA51149.1 hypothetical protein BEN35_14495 [Streptomyces fradiae]